MALLDELGDLESSRTRSDKCAAALAQLKKDKPALAKEFVIALTLKDALGRYQFSHESIRAALAKRGYPMSTASVRKWRMDHDG